MVPGVCEASALVWSDGQLLVGDNEASRTLFGLSLDGRAGRDRALPEEVDDIEALVAGTDGRIWVVGSQGRKDSGKADPDRERVLTLPDGRAFRPDLSGCPPCAAAAGLPPKQGGIAAEGALLLADHLWLGLRSPLVGRDALLLELEPGSGRVLRTVTVALEGRGIRDLTPAPGGGWLVLAGSSGPDDAPPALFALAEPTAPPVRVPVALPDHTEGIVVLPSGELAWVTDGEGKDGACTTPSRWGRISLPAPAGR